MEIFNASILYFLTDPSQSKSTTKSYVYYEDGLLFVKDGYIFDAGDSKTLQKKYNLDECEIDKSYKKNLIVPGFVDTHIHYAQTEMIGSLAQELLPWLKNYTFPTEEKFSDAVYCKKIADFFIEELLKNGTTTALVLATVHKESVDAIFEAAQRKSMRLIAGKVMMDTNAPKKLQDTPKSSYEQSEALIRKWHEKGRLSYAITPRFAITSTQEQLHLAGAFKKRYPSTYLHTHLSENRAEVDAVAQLHPNAKNYLDVYMQAGLVTSRSIFAHALHLEEEEYRVLQEQDAAVSFCPTSNLFLGSGLFKIRKVKEHKIRVGIGTDVGAGTSFNMLQTLQEAYKITAIEQNGKKDAQVLSPLEAFYQATLGGAHALCLENKIGKLEKGYEADFVVLNFEATALQRLKLQEITNSKKSTHQSLQEKLFALIIMGDDRNIVATYVNGSRVF